MAEELTETRVAAVFFCDVTTLARVLTDARDISRYTRSRAESVPSAGGVYRIFDGAISGEWRAIEQDASGCTLKLSWRMKSWAEGCFSDVEIRIRPADSGSVALTLTHTRIPRTDAYGHPGQEEVVLTGWKERILGGIKSVLGIGMEFDD